MTDPIEAGIRPPGAAGFFYPSSAPRLTSVVEGFLAGGRAADYRAARSAGSAPPPGPPVAVVAPHAGYDYSGAVAGMAYATLRGHGIETAVVIAPSHLEAFPGASIFPGTAYRTPLGDCPIDLELSARIIEAAPEAVRPGLSGHWLRGQQRQEHSLEVQIPFLQVTLGDRCAIVPMVIGDSGWATVEALGRALAAAVRSSPHPSRTVLIASTDLSHFHGDTQAETIDAFTLGLVERFDPRALYDGLRGGRAEACGGEPVVTVMVAARELGASRATLLAYTHSGRVMGDDRSVVGYAAIRFD